MTERILKLPYVHDCDQCIWVGWTPYRDAENGYGNMYFCPPEIKKIGGSKGQRINVGKGLVIIRYGDRGNQSFCMPIGIATKCSLDINHKIPMTAQQTYDLAVEAIGHVEQANWGSRGEAARKWFGRVLAGDDSKSLDEIQEEVNDC